MHPTGNVGCIYITLIGNIYMIYDIYFEVIYITSKSGKAAFSVLTQADPRIMLATLKFINLSPSLPLQGKNIISMLSPSPAR